MSIESMPVSAIMTKNVKTAKAGQTVKTAAKIMSENGIGSVVVVKDDAEDIPVGIITEKDIVRLAGSSQNLNIALQDVMRKPVITADVMTSIKDAMQTMQAKDIRRLPVVEKGRMVGIVTEKDIFRAILKNQTLLTGISNDVLVEYRPAYERLTEFMLSEIYFPGGNR